MTDPLLVHLLDIVSDPASEGLILAGGFGIRLKQAHIQETGERTLIEVVPEARATQDLDFFLSLSLFVQNERGQAVRALLNRLDYSEYTPKWQFGKPFDLALPAIKVKVDLLARTPNSEEGVRVKGPRVGVGSGIELHGRETPEAFAIEERPISLPISGVRSDGVPVETRILTSHPYAWLNMKIQAAHDWLRMERGEIKRKADTEKHVFDVYVLTAMMLERELNEAAELAERYQTLPLAQKIQTCATELFGSAEAPGVLEVQRQARVTIDYPLFWEALCKALNIFP